MKKVVSFMKVLALLLVPVLLIASCSGKEDPTTTIPTDHVHSYTEEVTIDGVEYSQQIKTYYYGDNSFIIRRLNATITVEGCSVINKRIYQYGLKDDGTYLREYTANIPGANHVSSYKNTEVVNSDGTTTQTEIETCKYCNLLLHKNICIYDESSNLISKNSIYYYEDGSISSSNTTNYTYINGSQYTLLERNEYQNSWNQYEYTLDIENCTIYTRFTSSYGEDQTSSKTRHFNCTYHSASCTQPSYEICNNCGLTSYNESPHGHDFYYAEDHWMCRYCGLESDDNTNGVIILEELHESESQNTLSYGFYYNDSNVDAIFTVSVYINGVQYGLNYNPIINSDSQSSYIYGQINVDLATLNSEITNLIEENNLEVESIILSVNALDVNSHYSTSITLSYSLNA